jgi:septal ring factor EnvC (AmiA/AmiB activator)
LAAAVLAQEQTAPAVKNEAADPLKTLKQRDEELKAARDEQRRSAEAEATLKREIEQIGADRTKLNQDLIDTAARLRGVEAKVESTQERLKPLDENESSIRKSLDGRRAVIGEVLAALQRMGRQPPRRLLVRRRAESVRTPSSSARSCRVREVESLANDLSGAGGAEKINAAEQLKRSRRRPRANERAAAWWKSAKTN